MECAVFPICPTLKNPSVSFLRNSPFIGGFPIIILYLLYSVYQNFSKSYPSGHSTPVTVFEAYLSSFAIRDNPNPLMPSLKALPTLSCLRKTFSSPSFRIFCSEAFRATVNVVEGVCGVGCQLP